LELLVYVEVHAGGQGGVAGRLDGEDDVPVAGEGERERERGERERGERERERKGHK